MRRHFNRSGKWIYLELPKKEISAKKTSYIGKPFFKWKNSYNRLKKQSPGTFLPKKLLYLPVKQFLKRKKLSRLFDRKDRMAHSTEPPKKEILPKKLLTLSQKTQLFKWKKHSHLRERTHFLPKQTISSCCLKVTDFL